MLAIYQRFIQNHVLANLTFGLILLLGLLTYLQLPREQDPTINFNWIQVTTLFPGASSTDVEKKITEPLEEALQKISDIRFVSSVSRDSVSSILVRFRDIPDKKFQKRVADLRRELQNKQKELPGEVDDPEIVEITSANGFPTATLVLTSHAGDEEQLRIAARNLEKRLTREPGIDKVDTTGLYEPEILIHFDAYKLYERGVTPAGVANALQGQLLDISAGNLTIEGNLWIVRWLGTQTEPSELGNLPIPTQQGEIPLREVATIAKSREKARDKVSFLGRPGVMLNVRKQESANVLDLVDDIRAIIDDENSTTPQTGISITLIDDQTFVTETALSIMQTNALYGLLLVLFSTWFFLGFKIAALVSIGIPFTLAATFIFLGYQGFTLNMSVLLGVVIALGMLVDDSVVVVESIYFRLERGMNKLDAIVEGIKEVFAPVTSSILTTASAFIPLMLLPGILGKFMLVIPVVVTAALLFSLIEAYWMLPAHIGALRISPNQFSRNHWRSKVTRRIRTTYTYLLIKVFKNPVKASCAFVALFVFTVFCLLAGWIKVNYFAMDPLRIFYINLKMPPNTPVEQTLAITQKAEQVARQYLQENDLRQSVSYAGLMFTETEMLHGEQYGQIIVSLKPYPQSLRDVDEIINSMRQDITHITGPNTISFLRLSGGPPVTKPINIKVRGDNFKSIRAAVNDLKSALGNMPFVFDISDNDSPGQPELRLSPNYDSLERVGLPPSQIARNTRLLVDGEVLTELKHQSDSVGVRLQAKPESLQSIEAFLQTPIALPQGGHMRLKDLVHTEYGKGLSNIRHYNFRKTISISADIDKDQTDTVSINQDIKDLWQQLRNNHPSITLDFSGELDDIEESLTAMPKCFLIGLGLMYLILGTQFKSYWQPFMVLSTVPLAFCGVILGLIVTRHPLSLYTIYGVVALSGIAVNAAIVLISAANQKRAMGMRVSHAIIFSAKRRVIPILITSTTTIAGLFSLATGLGGKSLIWGPVATAIVWGLVVSTILTLFAIPLIYWFFLNKYSVEKAASF